MREKTLSIISEFNTWAEIDRPPEEARLWAWQTT